MVSADLDDSIKFMHVSAPIRVMEPRGVVALSVSASSGSTPRVHGDALPAGARQCSAAEFGAADPQQVLQYMKLGGP